MILDAAIFREFVIPSIIGICINYQWHWYHGSVDVTKSVLEMERQGVVELKYCGNLGILDLRGEDEEDDPIDQFIADLFAPDGRLTHLEWVHLQSG